MNEWYETWMWITPTVSARATRKRFLNFSVLHNVSKEKESVPFPYKPFDAVTASSAEQEEDLLFVWVQLEVKFHNGCQPVNAAPQIRITGSNVNLPESRCVIQHGGSLLSGRAVLPRLNSRFPGQVSLSGSQNPDGKRMMRLMARQEV